MIAGLPGSQNPPGSDWIGVRLRELAQEIEQLRGQHSRMQLALNALAGDLDSNGVVSNVVVAASSLTVTFGDGSTHTYPLA